MDKEILEEQARSIVPLSLRFLKKMDYDELIEVILIREEILLEKQREFLKSINHNDREVFSNQKEEIDELNRVFRNKEVVVDDYFKIRKMFNKQRALLYEYRKIMNQILIHLPKRMKLEIQNNLDRIESY